MDGKDVWIAGLCVLLFWTNIFTQACLREDRNLFGRCDLVAGGLVMLFGVVGRL
jgi:hypothetical protein